MRVLSTNGLYKSRADTPPLLGRSVRWRTLQVRGAEMPADVPPGCDDLLHRGGLALVVGGMILTGGWL